MRVLQFVNTTGSRDGGPALHALEVNRALNRLGVATQMLIFTRGSGDDLSTVAEADETLASLRPRFLKDYIVPPKILGLITGTGRGSAWIVHGYYLWWVPPLVLLARLSRVPVLLMPHGSLTTYDRGRSFLKKRAFDFLFGPLLRRGVTFCVATETEKAELPGAMRYGAHVVGAGVTTPSMVTVRTAPRDVPVVLCLSRIAVKKRIDLCIAAVAEARAMRKPFVLRIAGGGDDHLSATLRAQVTRLGVEDEVEFVGPVEVAEKAKEFQGADIYMLPSDDENFGIAVVEALAAGLPVIVSDRVASAVQLPAGAGVVLHSPNPRDLAGAVAFVARTYEGRSSQAQEYAQTFSWTSVAERWATVLELSVRDRPGRWPAR